MTLVPKDRQLLLPGFKCTPVGLVPNKSLTVDQWEQAGDQLGHIDGRLMWYIGDWLRAGEDGGYIERGKHEEACERFGITYGTSAIAKCVCDAFGDQSLRRLKLSFGHHQTVAKH